MAGTVAAGAILCQIQLGLAVMTQVVKLLLFHPAKLHHKQSQKV